MSERGEGDDGDDAEAAQALADELVRFFLALPEAARRDYEALASKDERFGEDVAAERRAERSGAP